MMLTAAHVPLVVGFAIAVVAPGHAFAQNPCAVITKAEAEALVGARLEGPELSPGKTLCKYLEPGYEKDPVGKKLVTIGVFRSPAPDPEAVNMRRQFVLQDQSLTPVVHRDIPNFGDAAIWVWAGGYLGSLYAFKGGQIEVTVKIGGIREPAALAAARKFATRALGGSAKTGFRYAQTGNSLIAENYNAPGILGPLYLGTFDPIPDDEMTRNYVVSLVQAFNGSCESVPEIFAVMDYGFYYFSKANKGTISSANRGNIEAGFASVLETMHRAKPHMLEMGHEDASTFLQLHQQGDKCYTGPVEQLYNNIARLANARRKLPPDVPDYAHFLEMLSPAARKENRGGFAGQPSAEEEKQFKKIKTGCLAFTKGAMFSMEGFCRCHVDAAREAQLSRSDLDVLGGTFTQATLDELSRRSPEYERRKDACYS